MEHEYEVMLESFVVSAKSPEEAKQKGIEEIKNSRVEVYGINRYEFDGTKTFYYKLDKELQGG
jgi:hypothetical protein